MTSEQAGVSASEGGETTARSWGGDLSNARSRVPWLFRRAWVFVVCVALVLISAGFVSSHRTTQYSARAVLLVNPGASKYSPGSAQEAANLATTYAGLIPADEAIVGAVATKTGLTFGGVQGGIAVTVQNGTSLLVVTFTSASRSSALAGANATAAAISGASPVSPAIPAGTVAVTQHATSATMHHTSGSLILAVGTVLGFVLGAILVIAWERADPRLDHPAQVSEALGIPARSVTDLSDSSALAIMRQWQSESGVKPTRVAFIAGISGIRQRVMNLADRFAGTGGQQGLSVLVIPVDESATNTLSRSRRSEPGGPANRQRPGRSKPPQGTRSQGSTQATSNDIELLVGGTPGAEGGEAVAQQADATVLVLPQEAKVREVQRAVATLGELGVTASWALVTKRDYRPLNRTLRRHLDGVLSNLKTGPHEEMSEAWSGERDGPTAPGLATGPIRATTANAQRSPGSLAD